MSTPMFLGNCPGGSGFQDFTIVVPPNLTGGITTFYAGPFVMAQGLWSMLVSNTSWTAPPSGSGPPPAFNFSLLWSSFAPTDACPGGGAAAYDSVAVYGIWPYDSHPLVADSSVPFDLYSDFALDNHEIGFSYLADTGCPNCYKSMCTILQMNCYDGVDGFTFNLQLTWIG